MPYLTADQIAFFEENGYIVIPDFWTPETVDALKARMQTLVTTADLSEVKSIFSTKENMRKADDYFLNSGYAIRYFWEEKAWNDKGEFVATQPTLAINKVGHALHDMDELYERVSYEPRIGSICAELGLEVPLLAQSMYIFKQPRVGGEVGVHQDGAFLYTEPQSCIGLWWALDDCTLENGCLWAVPGSHKLGVHRRFRRRDPPNEGTEFLPLEPIVWDLSTAVPLKTKRGSLVVLHNALVHYSKENLSSEPRHAYSIHVVDGKPGVVYPRDNWLQRPTEHPFREIVNRV